jgi:hypothetical protein
MDASRNDLLGELAADAALERTDFLVEATEQLRKFLDANSARIRELGGLVLIDDDPDYLSIAPDLTFRSRSRYLDDETGEWVSETEIIENASELVEIYNPADVYQAFAEAAREAAGLAAEPTAAGELMETAGIAPDEKVSAGDPYAEAADDWAAAQGLDLEANDEDTAARRLYDLALSFQERSQQSEARLIEQFEDAAGRLTGKIGDLIIVDDEDERLTLGSGGSFRAEVVPEESTGEWKKLTTPDQLVEFYDPTDVFGDLAESLAEAYPDVAQEPGEGDDDAGDDEAEATGEADDEDMAAGAEGGGAAGTDAKSAAGAGTSGGAAGSGASGGASGATTTTSTSTPAPDAAAGPGTGAAPGA